MDKTADDHDEGRDAGPSPDDYSGEFAELQNAGASDHDRNGVLRPRHAAAGVADSNTEHERERLSPGQVKSASGAPGDRPKGPSNTA